MKKILLLLLAPFILLASTNILIDERITDIYFANGIMNSEADAEASLRLIKNELARVKYNNDKAEMLKHHNFDTAYNESYGMSADIFESFLQVISQSPTSQSIWSAFKNYVGHRLGKVVNPIDLVEDWTTKAKNADLSEQVTKYKDSIKAGHGVIVIAHSQGNLFTNEAYAKLKPWMHNYFNMISVASPTSTVSGGGDIISWDNDLVGQIALGNKKYITNPIRQVKWIDLGGKVSRYPYSNYIYDEQVGSIHDERFKSEENLINRVDANVHAFPYYMGKPLRYDGKAEIPHGMTNDTPLTTDKAKVEISARILNAISNHKSALSQWKPKKDKTCGTTYCKDKSIAVTHMYDSVYMDKVIGNALVYPFNKTKGKLYKVAGKYVLASLGAQTIVENPRDGICYEVKETGEYIDGESKDSNNSGNGNSFTVTEGVIETTIAWNYELDIDMDLDMSGPNVHHDVKDIPDAGLEHAYVKNHSDVKPGDMFELRATGKKLANSQLEEECLDTKPVSIYAVVKTPGGSRFKQYQAQNFSELNLEKFAEIEVEEKISPKWICPALSDAPGWHNLYNNSTNSFQCIQCSAPYSVVWSNNTNSYFCNKPVVNQVYGGSSSYATSATPQRTYQDTCSDADKKDTCGCVPCEYIVRGMENAVEFGPIAGASVKIVAAQNYGDTNASVIYSGITTSNTDILKAGLIELSSSDKAKFDDDSYYVISAKGGEDLDRDDDLVRDDIPTPNEGTIHAIIKGSDIKLLSFRLNVLTEAIFQVSGGVLGPNYDAIALEEKLDDGAKKLIKEKLYPTDSDMSIVYRDILLWAPGVDKKVLYKPYDIFVEPIVEKTYSDSPRFDESYALIYEPFISNAPLLSPISLEIPQGLPNYTPIAKVVVSNDKTFVDVEIQGSYSDYFSMSSDGTLSIAKREAIHTGDRYIFKMRAIDASGNTGGWIGLNIQVTDGLMLHNPNATVPHMVSIDTFDIVENSIEGTVVANAMYDDSNQTIVEYKLVGDDKNSFRVDTNGVVTVGSNENIDYETSKVYSFSIIAINDAGNESYPIMMNINILNEIDTPLYSLVFFKHVEENTALGTEIGKLELLRAGLGPIEKFEILSPNIPFEINKEGTVSISGYLDYEQTKSYRFIAIAKSRYGDSNKIECQISIDNQDPELGIPSLKDLTIKVDERVMPGTKIGQLELTQGATDIIKIALYGENDNFTVDTTGAIYLASSAKLDYEEKSRYDLGARALNSRGYGNEVHIVIEIANALDEVAILEAFKATIEENLQANTIIGSIKILSPGEGSIDSFKITGEGSRHFIIDVNGTIRVSSSADLDYEKQTSYVFPVSAIGSAGDSLPVSISIFLTNLIEHVAVIEEFSSTIPEDIVIDDIVGQIKVIKEGASPIEFYKLSGYGVENFSIDNQGVLKVIKNLNYENEKSYNLNVTAHTLDGSSDPKTLSISVVDVNEAPVINSAGSFTTKENEQLEWMIKASDEDSNTTLNYLLSSGDSSSFTVETISGRVRFKELPNYESKNSYIFTAIVSDGDLNASKEITINIGDINEAPIIDSNSSYTTKENQQLEFVIKASDEDSNTTLSYSINSHDSQDFTINSSTGLVEFKELPDYEAKNSYIFTATVSDGELEASKEITISVENVNDAATYLDFNGEISEEADYGTIVGQIQSLPLKDTIATSIKLSGEGSEHFSVDSSGVIKLANTQLDYESKYQYTLQAKASTKYGDSNEVSVTIEIIDVDEYGEAGLGKWGGASVKIYKLEDNATKILKFSETTSIGSDVDSTGVFNSHRLELEQNSFYIYEVSGGEDYDVNNDGVLDVTPRPNSGTIHAIVKGSWVRHISWRPRVNLMSEVFYQWGLKYIDDLVLLDTKLLHPERSGLYIIKDLNGDSSSNAIDALIYNPVNNIWAWDSYRFPERSLEYIKEQIYENNPAYTLFISNSFIYPSHTLNGDIAISSDNNKIFSVDEHNGLRLIDISDLNNPSITDIMPGIMRLIAISADNQRVFIESGLRGDTLTIVDISDINNPVEISKIYIPYLQSMQLSKDETKLYITIAGRSNGLKVIDISDATQPVIGEEIQTAGDAIDLILSEDEQTAYMADARGGLQIIDISDSDNFKLLGTYITNGLVEKVLLSNDGTKAYLTVKYPTSDINTQKGYINVIDIMDKSNPSLFAEFDLKSSPLTALRFSADEMKIFVSSSYPDYNDKIYENVGYFQGINLLGETTKSYYTSSNELILLEGETVMLAVSYYKIDIIDISDPTNPILIKTIQLNEIPG